MPKTVFITGISSGIGKAAALFFQRKGWNVAGTVRNPDFLEKFPGIDTYLMDVTDPLSVERTVNKVIAKYAVIDCLVNNAGKGMHGVFEGATMAQTREIFEINVFSVMNLLYAFLPKFRQQRHGTIINVSSMGGRIGLPLRAQYNSSKFAVEGLSEVLMYELSDFNIRVRIIEPGFIQTSFHSNLDLVSRADVPEYAARTEAMLKSGSHNGEGASPESVAEVIYKAAASKGRRLRYVAGKDAKLVSILSTILPFTFFSGLLNKRAV